MNLEDKQLTLEQVNKAIIELDILMSLTKDPALLNNLCSLYTTAYCLKLRLIKEASC